VTYGDSKDGIAVLDAVVLALNTIAAETRHKYVHLMFATLKGAGRAHLEEIMAIGTFDFEAEYNRLREAMGEAKGEVKGIAKSILKVLHARGVSVPQESRERIEACKDTEQLDIWLDRAVTAKSIDDLFV